jgi:hypothetical protein
LRRWGTYRLYDLFAFLALKQNRKIHKTLNIKYLIFEQALRQHKTN